jgi:hypothetical protein
MYATNFIDREHAGSDPQETAFPQQISGEKTIKLQNNDY